MQRAGLSVASMYQGISQRAICIPGSPIGGARLLLPNIRHGALLCTDIALRSRTASKGKQHNPDELSDKGIDELGFAKFVRWSLQ